MLIRLSIFLFSLFCGAAFAAPPVINEARPDDLLSQMIPDEALPDLSGGPRDVVVAEPPDEPPPPILRDLSALPAPAAATHARLMEIAERGDIEALRPDLTSADGGTILSFGDDNVDPIAQLRRSSGDDEGFEILAILIEVLQAGFVHLDSGTADEMFVWPYFVAHSLDELTPRQRVELFRVLTAGDVEDSRNFGSYIFYRVGIRPDGTWAFFVAGD